MIAGAVAVVASAPTAIVCSPSVVASYSTVVTRACEARTLVSVRSAMTGFRPLTIRPQLRDPSTPFRRPAAGRFVNSLETMSVSVAIRECSRQ